MGVGADLNGKIVDGCDGGSGESKAGDLRMGSFVGPTLIENKITKRVKNGLTLVDFWRLPNMRVMAVNNISAGINHLMS